MATVKRDSLTACKEWAKHLRNFWKRAYNKAERRAARKYIKKEQDCN